LFLSSYKLLDLPSRLKKLKRLTFHSYCEGDFVLLFLIVAKHNIENCPGGVVRPDKEFIKKTAESIKKSGVKLIDGYMDAPNNIFDFVLEANDNPTLNMAVEPLRLVGDGIITPVMKFFNEGYDWGKKIGIQE
jgi:hypothetical protein